MTTKLDQLHDDDLIARGDRAVREEHVSGLWIVAVLGELGRRGLHIERGYPSLADYCLRRWRFSRAKTFRYLAAARASERFPLFRTLLADGSLTISGAARLAGTLTDANHEDLLRRAAGKSFAEIEGMVMARRVAPSIPDRVRPLGVVRSPEPRPEECTLFAPDGDGTEAIVSMVSAATSPFASPTAIHSSSQGPTQIASPAATHAASPANSAEDASDVSLAAASMTEVTSGSRMHTSIRTASGTQTTEPLRGRTCCESPSGGRVCAATESEAPSAAPIRTATDSEAPKAAHPRATHDSEAPATGAQSHPAEETPPTVTEIRFGAGPGFVRKLRRAQLVCSHSAGLEAVLERALDELLDRHDPSRKHARRVARRAAAAKRRASADAQTQTQTRAAAGPQAPAEPASFERGPSPEAQPSPEPQASAEPQASFDPLPRAQSPSSEPPAEPLTAFDPLPRAQSSASPSAEPQASFDPLPRAQSPSSEPPAEPQASSEPQTSSEPSPSSRRPAREHSVRPQPPIRARRVATRRSRHVPAAVRDAVAVRDDLRCTFVGPDGVRCSALRFLQFDHRVPFALRGAHSVENGRVLCAAHNRLEARRRLGPMAGRRGATRANTRRRHE